MTAPALVAPALVAPALVALALALGAAAAALPAASAPGAPAAAAALPAASAPGAPATTASGAAAPARLLVSAREFGYTLSRPRIVRGRAVIQLLNRGEDDHDLRLRRISRRRSRPTARWAITPPGGLSELELRLSAGRYRLWCSLPGHRGLGMRSTLRVTASR